MKSQIPPTLHLGCGRSKVPGSLGVDISPPPSSAADVIWDLNKTPWPLPAAAFDTVYLIDVLEHLDNSDFYEMLQFIKYLCERRGRRILIYEEISSRPMSLSAVPAQGVSRNPRVHFP